VGSGGSTGAKSKRLGAGSGWRCQDGSLYAGTLVPRGDCFTCLTRLASEPQLSPFGVGIPARELGINAHAHCRPFHGRGGCLPDHDAHLCTRHGAVAIPVCRGGALCASHCPRSGAYAWVCVDQTAYDTSLLGPSAAPTITASGTTPFHVPALTQTV
jgi:hypothetical protein